MKFSVVKFDSLGSTNDYIKENCNTVEDYTVVWAIDQYAGRGRFSRRWVSSSGEGLTFSVKIPVGSVNDSDVSALPLTVGLSCAETMKSLDNSIVPRIKWPNDILLNNKKAGGILCERVEDSVIAGIGINVNTRLKGLESVDIPATSMCAISGMEYNLSTVLDEFLKRFGPDLKTLFNIGFQGLRERIQGYLYIPEKSVTLIDWNRDFSGFIKGINTSGELVLTDENGDEHAFNSGEISFAGL